MPLRLISRFLVSEDGPTAVEYAVMLGLITVGLIASIAAQLHHQRHIQLGQQHAWNRELVVREDGASLGLLSRSTGIVYDDAGLRLPAWRSPPCTIVRNCRDRRCRPSPDRELSSG